MARRAIILAGGKGTRLRPFTITLPKPLVPVNERPILDIILGQLKALGFAHVTLALNHFGSLIEAFCGDGSRWGLTVDYSRESQPLGSMGPLTIIDNLPDDFLVLNGDVLTDLDYAEFLAAHKRGRSKLTVGAFRRVQSIDFGVLTVGPDTRLATFDEKPDVSHLVSMGVYGINRALIAAIPRSRAVGLDEIAQGLLKKGEFVRVIEHHGIWFDLGKPDDFERAQDEFSKFI